jgi:tetratricopeptide (TPR) repeat protein
MDWMEKMKIYPLLLIVVFSLIACAPKQGFHSTSTPADEAKAAYRKGDAAMQRGDNKTAWKALTRAVELEPDNPDYLNAAGMIALLQERDSAAIKYFEKALTINLNKLGPDHPKIDRDLNNLGHAWQTKGDYDKAIEYFEKALAANLKKFGPDHANVARDWGNLGSAWQQKGNYYKAINYLEKALASNLKNFGPDHRNVANDWYSLGEAWEAKGEYDKAIKYYEKALASNRKTFGSKSPYLTFVLNNLGNAWQKKGEYAKAKKYYEKVLKIYRTNGLEPYARKMEEKIRSLPSE